ncbi:hypothetical protein C8R43DRAFT_964214 [Mycena crocata]|nr:hypothetical protein C8R43DRAFT_964214 [Mycena crocata]
MPRLHRSDSNTTHVSDSEPEREAVQLQAHKFRRYDSTQSSARTRGLRVHRRGKPFSDRSNAAQSRGYATTGFTTEARLMHIESEIARVSAQLCVVLEGPWTQGCTVIPNAHRQRSVADKSVATDYQDVVSDLPPHCAASTDSYNEAVQVKVGRQLTGLNKQFDEFLDKVAADDLRRECILRGLEP